MQNVGLLIFAFIFTTLAQNIVLPVTIYDFANRDGGLPQAHPDFDYFTGGGPSLGMVQNQLGADKNPVLNGNGNGLVTSVDTFNQWWRPVDGVNIELTTTLTATWDASAEGYTYDNQAFFPIDGKGWGNEIFGNNFGFCMELHTQFTYQAGQVFSFTGDDDVWVFIDDKLALDLGGPHPPSSGSIDVDDLGLTVGNTYDLDFFECERHVYGSTCKITTSIVLDPCGTTDSDGDGIADKCDDCPQGDPTISISVPAQSSSLNIVATVTYTGIVQGDAPMTVTYGDGTSVTQSANDVQFPHTYAATGNYVVGVSVDLSDLRGCNSNPSGSSSISVESNKIAPSCKNFIGFTPVK